MLVAGALWLYLTLSRTAAGALLVLQIFSVAIFLVAFSLMPEAHGDRFAISLAVITTLQRAVAIYLLAEFVWRRKPEPDVAPVFD